MHALTDQLDEEQILQAAQALEAIRQNSLAAVLPEIPGLQMPDHWPPRYPSVELLPIAGEPASEQLIRERAMTLYYLEASAWVKRYSTEVGSAWIHPHYCRYRTDSSHPRSCILLLPTPQNSPALLQYKSLTSKPQG